MNIPKINELYKVTYNHFYPACEVLGNSFREDPIWAQILSDTPEKFSLLYIYLLELGVDKKSAFGAYTSDSN